MIMVTVEVFNLLRSIWGVETTTKFPTSSALLTTTPSLPTFSAAFSLCANPSNIFFILLKDFVLELASKESVDFNLKGSLFSFFSLKLGGNTGGGGGRGTEDAVTVTGDTSAGDGVEGGVIGEDGGVGSTGSGVTGDGGGGATGFSVTLEDSATAGGGKGAGPFSLEERR